MKDDNVDIHRNAAFQHFSVCLAHPFPYASRCSKNTVVAFDHSTLLTCVHYSETFCTLINHEVTVFRPFPPFPGKFRKTHNAGMQDMDPGMVKAFQDLTYEDETPLSLGEHFKKMGNDRFARGKKNSMYYRHAEQVRVPPRQY